MVSHSQARNIILGRKERTLTQVDIWDTFTQETMNYDDKRFERFYSHYCANLVQKNDVKHRKDGHDLITMDQWIGALENKEDEEHYIKAWCYFIGKPFLYDKINFFEEFVKFCNEIDTGSTSLGEKLTNEDKDLKGWFNDRIKNLKRKWKDRMIRKLNYHISTSQNHICNNGKPLSENEKKESSEKQKETRKRKRQSEKGTIYFKHPKGKKVEMVCFLAFVLSSNDIHE